jgi:hypothetical protein
MLVTFIVSWKWEEPKASDIPERQSWTTTEKREQRSLTPSPAPKPPDPGKPNLPAAAASPQNHHASHHWCLGALRGRIPPAVSNRDWSPPGLPWMQLSPLPPRVGGVCWAVGRGSREKDGSYPSCEQCDAHFYDRMVAAACEAARRETCWNPR